MPHPSHPPTFRAPRPRILAVSNRHRRMSGIHFHAMSVALGAAVRRRKPLKILVIILLVVWIAPSLLLFFYLAWKTELLARYSGSLKSPIAEPEPNATERL